MTDTSEWRDTQQAWVRYGGAWLPLFTLVPGVPSVAVSFDDTLAPASVDGSLWAAPQQIGGTPTDYAYSLREDGMGRSVMAQGSTSAAVVRWARAAGTYSGTTFAMACLFRTNGPDNLVALTLLGPTITTGTLAYAIKNRGGGATNGAAMIAPGAADWTDLGVSGWNAAGAVGPTFLAFAYRAGTLTWWANGLKGTAPVPGTLAPVISGFQLNLNSGPNAIVDELALWTMPVTDAQIEAWATALLT